MGSVLARVDYGMYLFHIDACINFYAISVYQQAKRIKKMVVTYY